VTGEEIDTEVMIERGEDDERWVRLNCSFVPECGYLHVLLLDVTSEKKQLVELNGLHHHLDQFIYRASHNLRSPLTTLLGLLELARLNVRSTDSLTSYIGLMTERVKHLDDILLDLICIANNEKRSIDLTNVYLEQEARSVLEEYAQQNKGFTYNIHGNQAITFVTDLERLKIVLRNIISNAVKFSNPSIESHVELFYKTEAETAYIMVEDNGIGIDPLSLKKIFSIFFKATNNHPGAGLGLYIVRRVVDKLGGKINVTSTLHKGTTFSISIPNHNKVESNKVGTIL
jgi:signal transduction histidine kinase